MVEKSELLVRRIDFPANATTTENLMLLALALCWVVQVIRLFVSLQLSIGLYIVNIFYVIYLIIVLMMIILRTFFLFIVPRGTPDGTSPELIEQFGAPTALPERRPHAARKLRTPPAGMAARSPPMRTNKG